MFKTLCAKHNFNSKDNISHVLMNGGILSVPFDRLSIFYDICIQCIKHGEKIYVVEQKTDIYNFFLDVDYIGDDPLSLEEITSFSKTIFSKVKSFSSSEQKCIISLAKPKKKGAKIKTGIHLNFPNLIVDKARAIQLMYHVLHTLSEVYSFIDWSKFIDPCVYGNMDTNANGSGFRMPWSHKKSKHEACGGGGCSLCENSGKITEVSYLPVFLLEDFKLIELPIEDPPMKELLWLTTLRTNKTLSQCVEIPNIVLKQVKSKKEGAFTQTQTKNEIYNSELTAILETFIRKQLRGQQNSRITKLFKHNQNFLLSTNSKFCENLDRNHSSNHIWFFISTRNKTICQKCFCRCETTDNRRHGFCKDFSGRDYRLPPTICEIIFRDNNKK